MIDIHIHIFFLEEFSHTLTIRRIAGEEGGGEGAIFYSSQLLAPAQQHSEICLQLCMSDAYHIFLIASPGFNKLLLDEIFHLIQLPFE